MVSTSETNTFIMKRPIFLFSLLACGASMLQAAQLYDITLSNAEKYTQCQIRYKGSTMTKFTGKNKKGVAVTMEVKTSNILFMKESAAPKPEPSEEEESATEQPTGPTEQTAKQEPASDAPADAPIDAKEEPAPAENAEGQEAAEPENASQENNEAGDKAKDVSTRLRDKLAKIESDFATLSKPGRSITSRMKNAKSRIEANLAKLDKIAVEAANLQEQYNQTNTADYVFTEVPADQRDKYVQDGQAAYRAMVIDVKEKRRDRKIAGLDKFEIMRDRYQGLPEYKEAYAWYVRTLKDLEKKYTDLIAREDKRRKNLQPAKKAAMEESDREEYEKLADQLSGKGEDINQTWISPAARNRYMLNASLTKVKDALRRNENMPKDEAIGTVPSLLEQYWAAMDTARRLMIAGDLDGAEEALEHDKSFNLILRLKNQLLPEEFKKPLRAQHQDLEQEIKKRARSRRDLQRRLEQQLSNLERTANTTEAQINDLQEAVDREKDLEAANEAMEIEKEQPAPQGDPAPASADNGEKPAEA